MTYLESCWERLLLFGVSEETLQIVAEINGYDLQSLEEIPYTKFGYRSFDQL